MMKNHAELLAKLNELTQTAKNNNIHTHPNLPLKWELRNGVLYLDDIWIAPADVIDLANIDWYIEEASLGSLMIPTTDGTLDIIFYGDDQDFGIQHIERTIKKETRYTNCETSTESIHYLQSRASYGSKKRTSGLDLSLSICSERWVLIPGLLKTKMGIVFPGPARK